MTCGCSENINMTGGGRKKTVKTAITSDPRIYENRTVKELKSLAKEKSIKGRAKLTTKAALIAALRKA